MFSRTERRPAAALPSIVSSDMTVTGDIESEGTVQVEGRVVGDVRCGEITVGRDAEIRGQIECEKIHVHGTVNGEIRGMRVHLAATAHVSGDIVHEQVSIDAGAHVEGKLVRRDTQQAKLNLVVGENG